MPVKNDLDRLEIKDQTLLTAKKIIIDQGVKALTARKLAKENNYSVGTLYNLFHSIDEIIVQITLTSLTKLCETIQFSLAEIEDPEIKLQIFARQLNDFILTNPNLAVLIFADLIEHCSPLPEEYSQKINELFSPLENVFEHLFPAVNPSVRQKLFKVYAASLMGIMSLLSKKVLSSIGTDDSLIISELLLTMYLTGMKKLNAKSE